MNKKQFIKRVSRMVDEMATTEYDFSHYCPGAVRYTGKWIKAAVCEEDGLSHQFCKRCRELFCNPDFHYTKFEPPCPCHTWDDWEDLYKHVKKVAEENNVSH